MGILLDVKQTLESLQQGGYYLADAIKDVADAIKDVEDVRTLISHIHAALDGQEWNSGTAEYIADKLRDFGLEIRNPDDCDCDDRSWHGPQHDSACPLAGLDREAL